ncbi:transmembrane protease serine 11G-like [Poeciliopsis prolifica]|uniref:transmembrane protease serine 11G-like n=1 Tax=Poeciliopsis prolifica TaxID=188132 RepID=UPI002413BD36|nr:transmembrane protease serine 11G-like [Poeciliopsis prolifica]
MIHTGCIFYIFMLVILTGASESGIFGGRISKPHSRPYMASLQYGTDHMCGGILIRKDFVLTAAHCVSIDQVVLGAHNISKKEESQQRIKVAKFNRHPKYKGYQNDIMLLKLENNAKLNKNVQPIELPKKEKNINSNLDCLVVGWGKTGQHEPISTVLKEATEKTQFKVECDKIWKEYFIAQQMICTKFKKNTGGICQGDSGGPLICKNKLKGITAFTLENQCDNAKFPHVFTKVDFFLPWIKKIIQAVHPFPANMLHAIAVIYVLLLINFSGATKYGITGGKVAKPHSRPYMASLQIQGQHVCGGMLIRKDYVLTAAHCKDCYQDITVVLGAHNISTKEGSQQRINVKKYHVHPQFKADQYEYDIMLLELEKNAKVNNNVATINLAKKDEDIPANTNCEVAGWGKTGPNEPISDVLMETTESIQFSFECKHIWKEYFNSSHMICTKFNKKTGGICQGDSGGPLICNSKAQGIAAFTLEKKCDDPKHPHVFTKVCSFLQWMKKVMKG